MLLFMLTQELRSLQVSFHLLCGTAKEQIPLFATEHDVSVVVCDMSPLKVPMQWCKDVATELKKIKLPIVQVRTIAIIILVWVNNNHCVLCR